MIAVYVTLTFVTFSQAYCPDDWITGEYPSNCFYISSTTSQPRLNFSQARQFCEKQGGSLLYRLREWPDADKRLIKAIMNVSLIAHWLDVSKKESGWTWFDGSFASDYIGEDLFCGSVSLNDGWSFSYSGRNCSEQKDFICQKDGCPAQWKSTRYRCVKPAQLPKTYENAKSSCKQVEGSKLLKWDILEEVEVNRFLRKLVKFSQWYWVNRSDNVKNNKCPAMLISQYATLWSEYEFQCEDQKYSLCELDNSAVITMGSSMTPTQTDLRSTKQTHLRSTTLAEFSFTTKADLSNNFPVSYTFHPQTTAYTTGEADKVARSTNQSRNTSIAVGVTLSLLVVAIVAIVTTIVLKKRGVQCCKDTNTIVTESRNNNLYGIDNVCSQDDHDDGYDYPSGQFGSSETSYEHIQPTLNESKYTELQKCVNSKPLPEATMEIDCHEEATQSNEQDLDELKIEENDTYESAPNPEETEKHISEFPDELEIVENDLY